MAEAAPAVEIETLVSSRIDRESPVPVYAQIAGSIRTLIRERALPPGTCFPPERIMCERIGVSKMTLRQAYSVLERDGIIGSRRGVGTVVRELRVDKKLPEMRSFTEEMAARGKAASSRLLGFQTTEPSFLAQEFFGLFEHQKVFQIRRLRLGDGQPIAVETVELPAHLFPNLDKIDFQTQSLYRVLEDRYGIQLARCSEEISAASPNRVQKQLLALDRSAALLVITRKSFAINDSPVEVSITAYRGDLYTASIDAVRVR